ncbi:SMI1/KNR4 family protein [Paenibacillus hunanensis]|nr:SMI1/KNR4 family protein [Paenibacillus hunanensis]MCL9661874.1 SMI1/KNR4 family protein [Paenibacillus hunanensis]
MEQFEDTQTHADEPAGTPVHTEQAQQSLEQHIDRIEKHYGICFPLDYLNQLQDAVKREYQYADAEGHVDWSIHFAKLDDRFIANNEALVDEMNPNPQRIIPFAWSVSSGNYYLLDYRQHPEQPAVLLMEHEEAIVREDAEAEAEYPEQVQEMLEGNVRQLANSFEEFAANLKEQEQTMLQDDEEE